MKPSKAVEHLAPGTVLDDTDPAVQDFIREVYRNSEAHMPSMFQRVRTVRSVKVGRKYVAVTMQSYAIVTRPKGFEVGVL